MAIRNFEESGIVLGTRESPLAMIQTDIVEGLILRHFENKLSVKRVAMTTKGDQRLDTALYKVGGKSLFTKELELSLAAGQVDAVVHSLKDVPTTLPPGLELGAIGAREDPRDVLVLRAGYSGADTIESLPRGSVIGTSSVRRIAQLSRKYPHFEFKDIRGNLNTRLAKLDAPDSPYTGLVLAAAGVKRMGWEARISQHLDLLYAVGQGALAVELRENEPALKAALQAAIGNAATTLECVCERTLLRVLEGGCSVPIGVCTTWTKTRPLPGSALQTNAMKLSLEANICSIDGTAQVRDVMTSEYQFYITRDGFEATPNDMEAAEALGMKVAHRLQQLGGAAILNAISRA